MPQVAFSSWYDEFQIGKEPRVGRAQRVERRHAWRHRAAGGPVAMVKNGPLRVGVGQAAAVNNATLRSSGPTVFWSTPTTVWVAPSIVIDASPTVVLQLEI